MSRVNWSEVAADEQRVLAGHMLRRIGFGPSPTDVDAVLAKGLAVHVAEQLEPERLEDGAVEAILPTPGPHDLYGTMTRWYLRMLYSRRQLLEKMTLFWHEHFATSVEKVLYASLMRQQEELFRRHALGSFRELLVEVTRNAAMLVWLDNAGNSGRARDEAGERVPPNENYARELLQLFALGTTKLELDGTPVRDEQGQPVPAYGERDVREIARALTGWGVRNHRSGRVDFFPGRHDAGPKTVFGETIPRRGGERGAKDVAAVVDIIMRQTTVAPFIAKELILKFATETPTPGYVERVATAFRDTGGDIRETMRALLADREFVSPAVVRTQYKTPTEHVLGTLRALGVTTYGRSLFEWCKEAKQLVYYPPSVFGFYRPGQKGALVDTWLVTVRDRVADAIANGSGGEANLDAARLMAEHDLRTPDEAVDFLASRLLVAPLDPRARAVVLGYVDGELSESTFRGAAWLILCSPDFQLN
jgi:uncharacterized protein (DUF1800 family)